MPRHKDPKPWQPSYSFGGKYPKRDLLTLAEFVWQRVYMEQAESGSTKQAAGQAANRVAHRFCQNPHQLSARTLWRAIRGEDVDLLGLAYCWRPSETSPYPEGSNSLQAILARDGERLGLLVVVDNVAVSGMTGGPAVPRLVYTASDWFRRERQRVPAPAELFAVLRRGHMLHATDPTVDQAQPLVGNPTLTLSDYKRRRSNLGMKQYFVEAFHGVVNAAAQAAPTGLKGNEAFRLETAADDAKERYVRYLNKLTQDQREKNQLALQAAAERRAKNPF